MPLFVSNSMTTRCASVIRQCAMSHHCRPAPPLPSPFTPALQPPAARFAQPPTNNYPWQRQQQYGMGLQPALARENSVTSVSESHASYGAFYKNANGASINPQRILAPPSKYHMYQAEPMRQPMPAASNLSRFGAGLAPGQAGGARYGGYDAEQPNYYGMRPGELPPVDAASRADGYGQQQQRHYMPRLSPLVAASKPSGWQGGGAPQQAQRYSRGGYTRNAPSAQYGGSRLPGYKPSAAPPPWAVGVQPAPRWR